MTTVAQQGSEERATGLVTVGAIFLPLMLANTPLREFYRFLHHTPVSVQIRRNDTEGIPAHGWAVPTATDIVLALAVLSLFGKSVPPRITSVFNGLGGIRRSRCDLNHRAALYRAPRRGDSVRRRHCRCWLHSSQSLAGHACPALSLYVTGAAGAVLAAMLPRRADLTKLYPDIKR